MPQLKSILVKPYFDVELDDDTKVRIKADKKAIDRFQKGYKDWSKKFLEPQNLSDVTVCREGLKFLCGDEEGQQVYDFCMSNILADDPDLTPEDCIYQMLPIITYICEQWVDHIASMDFQRSDRVRQYLNKAKKPNAL